MAIKLVVFDMAGTTVEDNQNVAKALQSALKAAHYEVQLADINIVMGYPKPVAIRILLEQYAGDTIEVTDLLIHQLHDRFVDEMVRYYQEDEHIRAKDGAESLFVQLRNKGIKVGIDTGFSRPIADAIFNRLGWKQGLHYDVSVTSDEVDNGRPYPDMIFRAMELLDISSIDEVVKVGDTVSDLQEGNAAGCKYVIGITTGAYSEAELSREPHTHLIQHLEEIIGIISADESIYA